MSIFGTLYPENPTQIRIFHWNPRHLMAAGIFLAQSDQSSGHRFREERRIALNWPNGRSRCPAVIVIEL